MFSESIEVNSEAYPAIKLYTHTHTFFSIESISVIE